MLKRFVRYYKPHLGLFILDMFSAVIVAVCNLFYPTIAKNIVNGFDSEDFTVNVVVMNAILLLVIYIIKAVFQYVIPDHGAEKTDRSPLRRRKNAPPQKVKYPPRH